MKTLIINPGATSTKIAVYEDDVEIVREGINHDTEKIAEFHNVADQMPFRRDVILETLDKMGYKVSDFDAICGRGGLFRHIPSGTYLVDDAVIADIKKPPLGQEHASNLGAYLAKELGDQVGIPAFFVDPVCVDEFEPIARISGLGIPGCERQSFFHALNHKATAREAAAQLGKAYEDVNLVVAHMGGGVTVGAHKHGRVVDVNNVKDEGAMGMDRAGTIPANALVNLCFKEGMTKKDVKRIIGQEAGVYSYVGTKDFLIVENKAFDDGDEACMQMFEAVAYQISKDIGGMAAVMNFDVDAIVLTGGMAKAGRFVDLIRPHVEKIAPIIIIKGEMEMKALALGALRAVKNGDYKIYEENWV